MTVPEVLQKHGVPVSADTDDAPDGWAGLMDTLLTDLGRWYGWRPDSVCCVRQRSGGARVRPSRSLVHTYRL